MIYKLKNKKQKDQIVLVLKIFRNTQSMYVSHICKVVYKNKIKKLVLYYKNNISEHADWLYDDLNFVDPNPSYAVETSHF